MGTFKISLSLKQAKRQKQAISSEDVKGYFLWIGTCGTVDWILGYHKKRGWIADKVYHTGNTWTKDLFKTAFDKDGHIRLTRFI